MQRSEIGMDVAKQPKFLRHFRVQIIILASLFLIGLGSCWYWYYSELVIPAQLPAPLPTYPNGLEVPLTVALDYSLTRFSCDQYYLVGEHYKLFITNDSAQKVQEFYQQAAAKRQLTNYNVIGVDSGIESAKNYICFKEPKTLKNKIGTNVVAWLDPNDSHDANIIRRYFTGYGLKELYVIVFQGSGFNE